MTKKIARSVSLLFALKKVKMVMKLTVVLLLCGSYQISASANKADADPQQMTVTGRITDNDGQALPGVNVVEQGTTNGASSDVDGRFSINVSSSKSVLVFSFIGYAS